MFRLILLILIILVKIALTWLALHFFVNLTIVSDPFTYATTTIRDDFLVNRTSFVGFIASSITEFSNPVIPHYIFSVFSGIAIWILLREIPARWTWITLPLLFLPSVSMWSALVSKESLAAASLCLILTAWIRIIRSSGSWILTGFYFLFGMPFYTFLRPHFALGALALFVGTVLLKPGRDQILPRVSRLNTNVLAGLVLIFLISVHKQFFNGLDQIIRQALVYFTLGIGGSSRNTWLTWNSESSFYDNAWWAIPFSVIGPLPSEIIEKTLFIPAFFEGVFIFLIPFVACILLVPKIKKNPEPQLLYLYRIFFLLLPLTTIYLYIVHAPLGTMNPGSAIRYRTGFEYLITIPWIYIGLKIYATHHVVFTDTQEFPP